jgi:2-polyprenyl-6-methoxyphenol hydroxylase-like FAD-dependent oxidoreductase
MSDPRYDVIVVGARCAGSPLAMLLARHGFRVLVVDRATFPSDTVSTHVIHPPGIAALRRWGLADRVAATGCPPIGRYSFDFGPVALAGAPGSADSPHAYAPRRTRLDKILVDAAAAAGAEIREGFTVEELLIDDGVVTGVRGHDRGGRAVVERARVVVGADGRNSVVAKEVRPCPAELGRDVAGRLLHPGEPDLPGRRLTSTALLGSSSRVRRPVSRWAMSPSWSRAASSSRVSDVP